MILLDTTNASSWRHASGLARVSRRLLEELGPAAREVQWPSVAQAAGGGDWILTPELFSEAERPGFRSFLGKRPCPMAAVYHDAIPIKLPHITWPKSVERHPEYMKMLSRFDRVWAVSKASRSELLAFWGWQGVTDPPAVEVLALGADWPGIPRIAEAPVRASGEPRIVVIGIIEPRKNQGVLLDAFDILRSRGVAFELHFVGRVNPHFGDPMAKRIAAMAARHKGIRHHEGLRDAGVADLVRSARATAFPSIAEGCGLPVLESLWMGVPCICSDIDPVLENAAGGGCAVVPGNTLEAWVEALGRIIADDTHHAALAAAAARRSLPTWAGAARTIREALS